MSIICLSVVVVLVDTTWQVAVVVVASSQAQV
jgi:hypothetical protein